MESTTAADTTTVPCSTPPSHVHADMPCTPCSILLPRRNVLFLLGALFVTLAAAAALRHGQVLLLWDEPIQRGVEARRTSLLDDVFLTLSRLGSTIPVLVLGTSIGLLTWRRCRAVGIAVLVATFSRPLLESVIKLVVNRDRPDFERMVDGVGYSFPSGHVMAAVALWGLMPLVVSLYTRRRWVWWLSVVVSGGLIAGIAASRVYLGVHWFTDVSAGLIVGTFFLLGVDTLVARQHTRYPCPAASSTAVSGRWSDSRANDANPGSPGAGTDTPVALIPAETHT
jgi:undecaprenyl-diphosphatase